MTLTLKLPYPPTTNHLYATVRGRRVLSRQGRAYHQAVGHALRGWPPESSFRFIGTLSVQIELYPPDRRRRDIDGCLKALLDALTKSGVWDDDSQVARLLVLKLAPAPPGYAVVKIEERDP